MSTSRSDWKHRLTGDLEPVLEGADAGARLSPYHDMPFAIFHYPPEVEFELRTELFRLATRLRATGKQVIEISLARCLEEALTAEGYDFGQLADAEKSVGLIETIETLHEILTSYQPLDDLVASHISEEARPDRTVAFLFRAGSLYPFFRCSALLEQMKGKVAVPTVLFYPGVPDGPSGLCFMGTFGAEHSYRTGIF